MKDEADRGVEAGPAEPSVGTPESGTPAVGSDGEPTSTVDSSAEAEATDVGNRRRDVQAASGWVLVSAVVGFIVGFAWIALAPRVTLTVAADGITQDRGAASVPFDADLLLGGLLLTAGVVLSVVWLVRGARFATAAVIGLVLGGLLAGGIAVAMAAILTEGGAPVSELPVGTTADAPLRMRSWPMLLWWPAAVLVAAAVNSLRSESAPDPSPAGLPAS